MSRLQPRIPTASALGVHQILGQGEESKKEVEFLKKAKDIAERLDPGHLAWNIECIKNTVASLEKAAGELKNLQDSAVVPSGNNKEEKP